MRPAKKLKSKAGEPAAAAAGPSAAGRRAPHAGALKEVARRKYAPGEGRADRRILICTREDQERRVAVVAEGRLEELYLDRVGENTLLGNVYLGKVVNVEPSIGAAFVDFGEGKNGFLHAADIVPAAGESRVADFLALGEDPAARAAGRRNDERTNIDELIQVGEELVVQVTKDGIGHKGPTLSTYLAVPGCYLVLMPNLKRTGVSRKISDTDERRRLREILRGLELPEGLGFIIRTAGEDHARQDLERDAQFLMKMWTLMCRRLQGARAPASLYRETDLILRSLRDLFTPDTVAVAVDTERHYKRCVEFMKNIMPQYVDRVALHDKPKPLFTEYGIDQEVEKVYQRKIPLRSGGTIVFDQAEALVAIDVNSGKNKEEADLEETALKTNLEAIPELVRQLRLRDLGGLVIIDFIDMVEERHRRRVERALLDELRRDRARFRMERMSMFGIIELTRQRVRPSLFVAASTTCPACGGHGTVKSAESVAHTILRRIRGELTRQRCTEIEVRLHPQMATYFQNVRRAVLLEMEERFEKLIRITPDPMLRYEDLRLAYHERPRDLETELEHHF
ncbi:MAG: Rne/Rng family ribonuclease [Planctomycetes bacterium]|nr:Rne/Rng family ribonuclease [Planctomycetota bacterium]